MSETVEELQQKNTFLEKSLSQLAKVSSVESPGSQGETSRLVILFQFKTRLI